MAIKKKEVAKIEEVKTPEIKVTEEKKTAKKTYKYLEVKTMSLEEIWRITKEVREGKAEVI